MQACIRGIDYDDEQAFASLLLEAERCPEPDRWVYSTLLSRIGHLSPAATGAFCGGLLDGSPHVQQALAESTTSLFDFRELDQSQTTRVLSALTSVITRASHRAVVVAAVHALGHVVEPPSALVETLLAILDANGIEAPAADACASSRSRVATQEAALTALWTSRQQVR